MYTGSLSKFDVLYHWTFGESEFKSRGGVFFSYLRDHKANIYFLQETYSERADDDATLFNADIESLEMASKIVGDFGGIAGLSLNVKKTTLGLGKWESNRNKPLDLKWFHSPVKILGIYFSYNIKENDELNFDKKIQKLQTKLDMWTSRDLTIFGRAMLTWRWGTPGRWGNPPRWGNTPVHIISHFILIAFTW